MHPHMTCLIPAAVTIAAITHVFSADARPSQTSPELCGYDDPLDLAFVGSPGPGVTGSSIAVADTGNDRVLVVDPICDVFPFQDNGAPVDFAAPSGVTMAPDGDIYVADTGNNRILKFNGVAGLDVDDPLSLQDVFLSGQNALTLDNPLGLGVDDDGLIYIANSGAGRIQIMDSAGFSQGTLGQPDNGDNDKLPGEFFTPADVAVCSGDAPGELAGRVFVTDRDGDAVHAFNSDGTPLFRFADTGTEPGLLDEPGGIDIDPQCNVYVADKGNSRIQMFDGYGGFLEVVGIVPSTASVAVNSIPQDGAVLGGGSDEIRSFIYIRYDIDGNGNSDDDGDALPDIWEIEGIDLDFDGTVEYDLSAMGADPRRRQIFVEVDYLTFHEPRQDALDAVIDAFANAPIENPDGSNGIDLIVTVDEEIEETPARADLSTWDEFDDLKGEFFGSAAERASGDDVLFAKLLAYRYGIYGHIRDGGGSSGRAKGGGNFLVTLGASGWGNDPVTGHDVGTFKQQAGTFMHELGHTLSLGHGGGDGKNFKPNYLSVMNYSYQTGWITNDSIPEGRLDYSSQRLPSFDDGALDEADLDEPEGLGLGDVKIPDDKTRFQTGKGTRSALAGDPHDWNAMAGAIETGLDVDVNGDGDLMLLQGQNDWDFLANSPKAFNFRDSVGFASFGLPIEEEEPELTDTQAAEIEAFWNSIRDYRYVYSAKFLCVPLVGPEGTALSPGRYQTAINVHNPSTNDVTFLKKVVIARNEMEKRGVITPLEQEQLADDEAISIDCTSIAARFDEPQPIGEGFVVFKSNDPLDVIAVYTSRDSVDVEPVEPVILEEEDDPGDDDIPPGRRADLTITLPSPIRVDCPDGQGSCVHTIEVEIANLGGADAGAFNVSIETDNDLIANESISGLSMGATQTFVVKLGPGDNCFNPNCKVTATVDDGDTIPEIDETNNVDVREDLG